MFNRHNQSLPDTIVYVDVDDTLCDTRKAVAKKYEEATGLSAKNVYVKSKRYTDFCPEWNDEKISSLFGSLSRNLYQSAEPIKGAVKGIMDLEALGYDVRIVTIQNPDGAGGKQEWINTHFPSLKDKVYYVNSTTYNKDIFKGLSIIDDDDRNIRNNKSTFPILLDIYGVYNANTSKHYCSSWEEVVRVLS